MKNSEILKIKQEQARRKKIDVYKNNFESFATDHVKITTKDATKGFIPFKFNEAQIEITRQIEEQRAKTGKVRALILKARQQGISTYCAGRVFWKTYFTPLTSSVILAHDSATSDALFNMSKNLIQNMDPELRPEVQRSNAKEIILGGTEPHEQSKYRLYTAGNAEAGRGTTPTILHCSEVAFWQYDEKILAGLFQGVPNADGTEIILESTANGAQGQFYRMWKTAERGEGQYIPIFIPWFITSEYRIPAPEDFKETLSIEDEEYQKKYDLDDDQMYWRSIKIAEGGVLKFKQEYPANADEAFLVSGSNVFDRDKLNALEPIACESTQEFDDDKGYFVDMREGSLEVWKYPKYDENFVVAADVALGVGNDYSAAVVLNDAREVCAIYRNNRIDPSYFADVLFYLSRYFNNALLCVESNTLGIATINRLKQMNYVNIYHETKKANLRDDEEGVRPGFRTTGSSKPAIIGHLKRAIEDEDLWIPSVVMIQELKDYIADENGKTNAAPGCHDDTVMSLAIGLEVLRTHGEKLSNNRVPWSQRQGDLYTPDDNWI